MSNMIRVSDDTYLALRTASAKYQFELGRQVSMGEIVAAALAVSNAHKEELERVLAQ